VVAVADAFDAMTSERPYRQPLSLARAMAEINDKAGIQFDPECARAFVRARARVEEAHNLNLGSLAETILPNEAVAETTQPPTEHLRATSVAS